MRLSVLSGLFFTSLKAPSEEDLADYYGQTLVVCPPNPDGSESVEVKPFDLDEVVQRLLEAEAYEELAEDHDPEGHLAEYIRRRVLCGNHLLAW